jgi:chromosome segregation ATPase
MSDHAKSAYRNVKRNLQTGPGSADTDALYSQVRAEDQQVINKLNHELEVTKEAELLAELERERDDLQRERSRTNAKRIEILTKEQTHRVELAKLEAIDRNRLGDRIKNIERIADIHVDALELQQKRLQLDSEVSILDIKITELQVNIDKQNDIINNLKNNDTESRG